VYKVAIASMLLAVSAVLPSTASSQGTPGEINDPSTYRGSMANQEQERQSYQQQEAANQQMQQRLDQNYAAYAPNSGSGRGSGGGGARAALTLKSKPLLPPASNPLIGRWRQMTAKEVELGALGAMPGVGSVVNGAFAGGCNSIFGKGMVAFTPTQFNWVAPDGHEEILNKVEYRSDGANVIVIPTDSDLPLIFGLPDRDHVVVAFLGCRMQRDGAKPRQVATATAQPATASGSGAAQGILNLKVGEMLGDRFSAVPAGTAFWVTVQDPDSNLVKAGFAPDPGVPPIEKLFAACKIGQGGTQADCSRGMQAMIAGALGVARTDTEGHAQTGAIPPGRYYVVGFVPYKGHSLMWHLPVDVKAGANAMTLEPRNGSISH
jgi:hypothetical protein